jgi:serine/threonine protein kinase
MDSSPFFAYSFLSPVYHENIYAYEPTREFLDIARAAVGDDWRVKGRGFWSSCSPPGREDLEHGWKIHLSSTLENASETLTIAARILSAAHVAFKFCSDTRMLKMSLGKGWSRFQIGKFITVYPKDVDEFKTVIAELHAATSHLTGPYILTDRPYRDSKVVYYRYGVHRGMPRVDAAGKRVSGFFLEDGTWYNDVRGPAFRLPPGVEDPFVAPPGVEATAPPSSQPPSRSVLLKNRYLVQGAIKFNATGGIYRGIDQETNREIVIREVRGKLGHLERESPDDPAFVLKREARIIQTLSPTGLVPAYVDMFQAWDHWFLVLEKLDAISLWGHSMEFYFSNEYQSVEFGLDKILSSIKAIGRGLQQIHAHGIVLRDLTKNNVLFTQAGNEVKFIDFEFAFELEDTGPWVAGWTPGYASLEQATAQRPTVADDCYAFGVLIIDMLTFCAGGLELGRDSILRKLRLNLSDLGLPFGLLDLVEGLTHPAPAGRWSIARALAHLESIALPVAGKKMFPSREELLGVDPPTGEVAASLQAALSGLNRFLDASLDLARDDRLWPAAPEVFVTNPVSLEYGAAGIAFYLLHNQGHVRDDVLDWIEAKTAVTPCPPGLHAGRSGVALLLLMAGRQEPARRLMREASSDPAVFDRAGLYYGSAGVGLALLHFWALTGDRHYLEQALGIGDRLLATAVESGHGLHWPTGDKVYLGLGEGQSGVALFLVYLAAATGEQRFTRGAGKALRFDLAHARHVAGRVVWKVHTASREQAPNLPHHKFGSAGVGAACLRYFALTGEERFRDVALDCAHTVRTRMSNKIWQEEGSAGYGEFLLDMAQFLGEPRFRDLAWYQAEAILAHALERPEGVAFGGLDHYRICADYSYGSSGIGMFFDRLAANKPRFLMLDHLLARPAAARGGAAIAGEAAMAT